MIASGKSVLAFGSFAMSSFSYRSSDAYSQPTWLVVKIRSVSGLALESLALFSRSIVPPVMYSTGTPVSAVKRLPMFSAAKSFQLPPQMLMRNGSCAAAPVLNAPETKANASEAPNVRAFDSPLTDPNMVPSAEKR